MADIKVGDIITPTYVMEPMVVERVGSMPFGRRDRIEGYIVRKANGETDFLSKEYAVLLRDALKEEDEAEMGPLTEYTCPNYPDPTLKAGEHEVIGCGATFKARADFEGLVDCPECGIWFKASEGATNA